VGKGAKSSHPAPVAAEPARSIRSKLRELRLHLSLPLLRKRSGCENQDPRTRRRIRSSVSISYRLPEAIMNGLVAEEGVEPSTFGL
jgi:hypothetical protein